MIFQVRKELGIAEDMKLVILNFGGQVNKGLCEDSVTRTGYRNLCYLIYESVYLGLVNGTYFVEENFVYEFSFCSLIGH